MNNRFLKYVNRTTNCWLWTGSTDGKLGYGKFWVEGRMVYAHRVAYYLFKDKTLPLKGNRKDVIDHKCRQPSCVNPEHLERVTQSENVIRGKSVSLNTTKSSKYVNIYYDKSSKRRKRWRVQRWMDGKFISLGIYKTEEEALEAATSR